MDIIAECKACGERREFDRNAVPTVLRQALIEEIEPKLKCSSCGAKSGKLLFGHYMD
jgi:uncharacterized Zn finger protein